MTEGRLASPDVAPGSTSPSKAGSRPAAKKKGSSAAKSGAAKKVPASSPKAQAADRARRSAARAAAGDAPVITVRGAREHNLKNVSVEVPRDRLVVFTGLSGSGKSSLAFDTIYAEGQRRYVESLSSYARQFLGQMDKPDVDVIEGLSPAISIDQKSASRNPRSTVGTITEVYDYLRLLYARIGVQHCPDDGSRLQRQTPQQIVDRVLELNLTPGSRFLRRWFVGEKVNTRRSSKTFQVRGMCVLASMVRRFRSMSS